MKCSAFWKHTNIRAGNRVYACCRFRHPIQKFDGNIENILQSDEYKRLREKSSRGEFIPGCEKCAYEESIGHKSLREEFNEKYEFDEATLDFLEIGFDNLCNLTCDGCNSEFSTSWIAKEENLYGSAKNKLMEIDQITHVPGSIKKVLFLGGEPLITEKHYHLITKLSDNTEIVYNTNATFIPSDKIKSEMQRHNTKFIISVDGYKEVNENVRHGTKWQQVLDFIQWVQDNNFEFEFNTVLHKNNLHDMLNLYDFITPYNKFWYVNVLTYPTSLDINTLSDDVLHNFLQQIDSLDFPNKSFIKNHINTLGE